MILKQLMKDLPVEIRGVKSIEIQSITADSRQVAPGSLFLAKKGTHLDGALFIPQAIANGAVAIVADFYNPFFNSVTQVIHPRPYELEPLLAARFYREPSRELFVFGVTGTNGKTTTTYLVKHLLDHLNRSCGLLSTVETIVGDRRWNSILTTHDAIFNQKMMREMKEKRQCAACLEVSSHGLDQRRVDEIEFDVALFTNLTADHLDYHRDLEDYALAKQRLFQLLDQSRKPNRCAIANAEDVRSQQMLEVFRGKKILFGLGPHSDVYADDIQYGTQGTSFCVHAQRNSACFHTSLIGKFNVLNLLGAISVGVHLGVSLEKMVSIFSSVQAAPGRLEKVANEQGFSVFVDYAHTEDALDNVLKTLRGITKGRLILVFGAGGGRDKGRREGLARAAERGADCSIVTSDNPRQEDPEEICRQILAGFKTKSLVRVELDRKKAIELAIDLAQPEDLILIAGKGHECMQIFSHGTVPFDDRAVALQKIREKL